MRSSLVPDEKEKKKMKLNRNFRPAYVQEIIVKRERNVSKERILGIIRESHPKRLWICEANDHTVSKP